MAASRFVGVTGEEINCFKENASFSNDHLRLGEYRRIIVKYQTILLTLNDYFFQTFYQLHMISSSTVYIHCRRSL